jgi:hypothetical protein
VLSALDQSLCAPRVAPFLWCNATNHSHSSVRAPALHPRAVGKLHRVTICREFSDADQIIKSKHGGTDSPGAVPSFMRETWLGYDTPGRVRAAVAYSIMTVFDSW